MSLQAIAGIAFDRRNSDSPSRAAAMRIEAAAADPTPKNESQAAAQQFNSALESVKRYIPTEVLALYLPFVAIAGDQIAKEIPVSLRCIYGGFIILTPVLVFMIYIAKAVEAGTTWTISQLPHFEALLASIAFTIWGASVPGVFSGHPIPTPDASIPLPSIRLPA